MSVLSPILCLKSGSQSCSKCKQTLIISLAMGWDYSTMKILSTWVWSKWVQKPLSSWQLVIVHISHGHLQSQIEFFVQSWPQSFLRFKFCFSWVRWCSSSMVASLRSRKKWSRDYTWRKFGETWECKEIKLSLAICKIVHHIISAMTSSPCTPLLLSLCRFSCFQSLLDCWSVSQR